ncbi:MAG: AI-2E family transporter [Eubacteriales bacterium]
MELNRDVVKKIRGLIVFTTLIIVCLWKSEMVLDFLSEAVSVLSPFIVGAAIAFIINVPMSFIERNLRAKVKIKEQVMNKIARPCSLILTIIFIIGIIVLVVFVVVPQLATTVSSLGENLQVFIPELAQFAAKLFEDNPEIAAMFLNVEYDWDKIVNFLWGFVQSGAGSVVDTTVTVALNVVSAFTTFFIGLIFSIYVVLQKEKLGMQFRKVAFAFMRKGRAEAVLEICALTYKTFSSFLTGQCLEAIILGSIFVIVLAIFKLPYALLIGILIAFTALIPVFGAFLGCFIGAFLIFIDDPWKALTFIIIFLVLQQIEGNLIYPHVVGNSVGLPSIWVLVAVSVGASLMGVVGMLIFIPITSVLYTLFREVVYLKLKKNKINPKDVENKVIG